jgi:hypothetical protein
MPNWVSNSVRVTGDKKELQRFAEQAGQTYHAVRRVNASEHLSFWNFMRPPRWHAKGRVQYKTNHWYDWNIRNWGCQVGCQRCLFRGLGQRVGLRLRDTLEFPLERNRAMVKQYPTGI